VLSPFSDPVTAIFEQAARRHSNPLKDLTDEQLEAIIEYIETCLQRRLAARSN
jgi:hypothetical protein